ncbi:MAG: Eco57I restriction-modification methylase domain-containing protein [Gammaproteobacteria bacterium]|nr:Eco57I restriction-modification methylase domain-containing protein [Gammaproteobacteria bacterium]
MPSTDFYANALIQLSDDSTEKDVISNIVRPTLIEVLGYKQFSITEEASFKGLSIFKPDLTVLDETGYAKTVVEVKRFNIDVFAPRKPNTKLRDYPLGQIETYLRKIDIVINGTWGILTNGKKWVILRKHGYDVVEISRFEAKNIAELIEELQVLKKSDEIKPEVFENLENDWIDKLRNLHQDGNLSPGHVVLDICDTEQHDEMMVQQDFAYTRLPSEFSGKREGVENEISFDAPLYFICMSLSSLDGQIAKADVEKRLKQSEVYKQNNFCFGIAYSYGISEIDEHTVSVRILQSHNDEIKCSHLIDLYLPTQYAKKLILDVQESSMELKIADALQAESMKRKFYEDLSAWFKRTSKGVDELRHLIRILFVWLLRERGLIDKACLDFSGDIGKVLSENGNDVAAYLDWLFAEMLAKPKSERDFRYKFAAIYPYGKELIDSIPYLNGSLFHELASEQIIEHLPNSLYLSVDSTDPGLFTILKRYNWTIDEGSSHISELAIDPNMLGLLFERLILLVSGPRIERGGLNVKMPDGAYYTPDDVVCEMTTDALAHWLTNNSSDLELWDVREVIHPKGDIDVNKCFSKSQTEEILDLVRRVRVLDPCVGSGAFIVGMLQAIHRVEIRLDQDTNQKPRTSISRIIEDQLFSVDKNALAVHITRFRLFLSLIQSELRVNRKTRELQPLPNLEFRHIYANTLCTAITKGETEQFTPSHFHEWKKFMAELNAVKQMFTGAKDHNERIDCLQEEEKIRNSFKNWLTKKFPDYDASWLDVNCFHEPSQPFEVDIRQLFSVSDWDIVIGNPPYQKLDQADHDVLGQGYISSKANLYTCFLEVANALTVELGCIEFIIPHSLLFARVGKYPVLRRQLEKDAKSIFYRTYDNTHPLFPPLPWLKTQKTNRQRVTILTLNKKSSADLVDTPDIHSAGYIRLNPQDRKKILQTHVTGVVQPTHFQWTQAPTAETVALLRAMNSNIKKDTNSKGKLLYFPVTAYNFITCYPDIDEIDIEGRINKTLRTSDNDKYWCWVGLYNSNVYFAYWLMVGDAFHVNKCEFVSIRQPPGWNDSKICKELEDITKNLFTKDVLAEAFMGYQKSGIHGNTFSNYDLRRSSTGEELIKTIDRLILKSYNLEEVPLLDQVQKMSNSAHYLWT